MGKAYTPFSRSQPDASVLNAVLLLGLKPVPARLLRNLRRLLSDAAPVPLAFCFSILYEPAVPLPLEMYILLPSHLCLGNGLLHSPVYLS